MFYVNTIIKRVGTKTFLTVYYYRRPYFYKYNYKNFIKSQIRTKLLKKLKVNKFQSIPFLLNNELEVNYSVAAIRLLTRLSFARGST